MCVCKSSHESFKTEEVEQVFIVVWLLSVNSMLNYDVQIALSVGEYRKMV